MIDCVCGSESSVWDQSSEVLELQGFRAEKMRGGDRGWNALLLWDLGEVLVEECVVVEGGAGGFPAASYRELQLPRMMRSPWTRRNSFICALRDRCIFARACILGLSSCCDNCTGVAEFGISSARIP